jgi:hypothetical protein
MRIEENTVYELRNGMLGHVNTFHVGDETIPAHYSGAIEGAGLHTWKPDGSSLLHEDYDIVARTKMVMAVKHTGGLESKDTDASLS